MTDLGYHDSARICLTHSFSIRDLNSFASIELGNDCTKEEVKFIEDYLSSVQYNDYDRLIQLCDYLSFHDGPAHIEKRFVDIALRNGFTGYTLDKWRALLSIKDDFDKLCGCDIYSLILP